MLFKVARKSLLNRKVTAMLTVLSIAVSVFVLLGVEHIRHEAKNSFMRTLYGTDLIVGGRTGQINLILYSVFRIGNATNNISWSNYKKISASKAVDWTIPLSLGDSHKGYRVLGTNDAYLAHYQYGQKQSLSIAKGKWFEGVFDVVLGSEVANKLGYKLGDEVILTHGVSSNSFSVHDDKPFTVAGVLEPTGTPVDQTLHVSLAAIEAIHIDWVNGVQIKGRSIPADKVTQMDLTPTTITAFMVGLKSKSATFGFQRLVNKYPTEALMAILPGATLAELWKLIGNVEKILLIISVLVLFSALIGMSTMLLSSLRERGRELSILRAIGASPLFNLILIELEVLLLTVSGILVSVFALSFLLIFGQDYLMTHYGLFVSSWFLNIRALAIIGLIIVSALLLGLIPAVSAYRTSIQQGLTVRQ